MKIKIGDRDEERKGIFSPTPRIVLYERDWLFWKFYWTGSSEIDGRISSWKNIYKGKVFDFTTEYVSSIE